VNPNQMIEWLKRNRERPVIVSQQPLTERELLAAMRVPEDAPLWRAVHQIIEEELEALRQITLQSVKDHGILASWVGGQEGLERLRARLIEERGKAMGIK